VCGSAWSRYPGGCQVSHRGVEAISVVRLLGVSCAPRAGWSITRRSSGCGGKKAYECRCAAAAARRPNRYAGSTRVAAAPNDVWAINFCFDATTDGRAIKITNIVDEHTRESLDRPIDRSVDADKLVDHLDKLAAVRGFPRYLRCDQRTRTDQQRPRRLGQRPHREGDDDDHVHRTRRALAEALGRVVQQPHARRVPRDQRLRLTARSPRDHRRLAACLQPRPSHSSLHYQAPAAYAATCTHQPQLS
jgi:putative transposase